MKKLVTLCLVACALTSSNQTLCMLRTFRSIKPITAQRHYASKLTVYHKNSAPRHIEQRTTLKTAIEKKLDHIAWLQRKLEQQELALLELETLNAEDLESLKDARDNDRDAFPTFPMEINKWDALKDNIVDLDKSMHYQRQDFKDLLAEQRPTNGQGHANE